MKYGRSLSFCVKDILSGKINIKDVGVIVTSTACQPSDWKKLIESYHQSYWSEYSLYDCETVMQWLLKENKIEQPRLTDGRMQALYRSNGNWADTYQEVIDTLEWF